MANFIDYLTWRGDLSFEQDSFNEVDNILCSMLAYVDFAGIVPAKDEGSILLYDAIGCFLEKYTEKEIGDMSYTVGLALPLMKKITSCRRFERVRVSDYINEVDIQKGIQFSALTFLMEDRSLYIAFRGTDESMVGWRENLSLSVVDKTPGQEMAISYVNNAMKRKRVPLWIGGHSKGGNLAVFAAVHCRERIKKHIVAVYNNDGPGFLKEMVASEAYQAMLPKIKTIIPEASIVGLLLEHEEDFEIIASQKTGIWQHDANHWQVEGNHFIRVPRTNDLSEFLDMTITSWLDKMDMKEREVFIEKIFTLLEEEKIETVKDLSSLRLDRWLELIKKANSLNEGEADIIKKSIYTLWEEGQKSLKSLFSRKRPDK